MTQEKVSGIKRHIAVATQGLPHAIAVMTAEMTDRKGALKALRKHKASLSKVTDVDGGYTGQAFAGGVQQILGATVNDSATPASVRTVSISFFITKRC